MTSYRPLPLLADEELATGPAGEAGLGTLATGRGNLPLEAVDVDAAITGLVARVVLTQTFGNPFDQPLEASYIFPLPDRAAVTGFRMEVGERVVEGVLAERGQARADYDRAIREGRRASIAEEERPGVFTMRVGNLLPGERVTVRLTMTGPLPWADGEASFRFPLVVAPRYIPGAPLEGEPVGAGTVPDSDAVPDASRITPPVLLPGFPNPVDLSITVAIDPAGLDLAEVRSSLHVLVEEERDGLRVVSVRPGERADRDFVLRLRTGSSEVATALAAAPDPAPDSHRDGDDPISDRGPGQPAPEGTFALTLLPPAGAAAEAPPRDVAFVLDRSGSMAGWKMVAARRAVARMVDSLTGRDRFLLLAFDNLVESPPGLGDGLRAATDHARFQAVEYLSRLDARGGTELAAPLGQALDRLAGAAELEPAGGEGPRDPVLVLVTDGQVGNEDQVLRLLAPRLGGVRVYTVGVDSAVNEGFLKRLAGLGGGACELVESEDRLDAVMDRVHRRIGAPLVTGLELAADGLEVVRGTLAPRRLPDLFAGSPLVVYGRFRGRPGGAVTVRGRDAAGQPWAATVPAAATAEPALAATWARAHLRDLEDRYAAAPTPDRALERRIVETSLRFGVLCRFTAFVAADVQVVNEGGTVHRVLQPVEAPAGWGMFERVGLAAAGLPVASMAAGGLQAAGLPLGREGGARAPARRVSAIDLRLGRLPGKAGLGRGRRDRAGGFAGHPLGEAELAPYRRRAARLAALLEDDRAPAAALRRRLGLVGVGLAALVADLESVDAPEEAVRPLRDLAAELAALAAGGRVEDGAAGAAPADDRPAAPSDAAGAPPGQARPAVPDPGELARLRELALDVLRSFADPAAPAAEPPARRDAGFWRR
jgi:Ca-activated chloride channel family protein